MILTSTQDVAGAATTHLYPLGFKPTGSATDPPNTMVMAYPGHLKLFYVKGDAAPGVGTSIQMTLFKNGVATAITVTLGAADTSKNDLTDLVDVVAGDEISLVQVTTGAPATTIVKCSLMYFTEGAPTG